MRNRLIVWSGDTRDEITTKQKKAMERLRSPGYLNARNPAEHSGVTKHNKQRAYQGLNLTTEGNTAEATLRDMDGKIIHQWRLGFEEAFPDRSEWPPDPQTCWRRVRLLLDGSLAGLVPAFSRGRILLSVLKISTIAVLDPESETIVWASKDFTHFQHQPTVVGGGKLLVFDNQGDNGRSQVLEFDPLTQEITWSYDNDDGDLFSETLGSCQRLPNGNTLITESNAGRVIEVTPDHEIVWEYYSPHRAGENNELITQVFELIRLPPDFPLDWAE